jgi:predicted nucleotidyltransferase
MNRVESALVRVSEDLESLEVRWALVGGFAVSVRTEPRLTRDVDVAIAVQSDHEAERVVRELVGLGWRPIEIVEQEAISRVATARLTHIGDDLDDVLLDVLFASCGIENEIAEAAERIEVLPAIVLPVATRSHLIAMKLLARDDRSRPQDADDLAVLIRRASPEELNDVRGALGLIMNRGFNRRRNLLALFDQEVKQSS